MQSDKPNEGGEPLALTIAKTTEVTSESRSTVYNHLADGTYEAVKSGKKTLILYASIKRRFDTLPRAVFKARLPKPLPHTFPQARRRGRKPKPAGAAR
jgi:hypothetical protein